MRAHVDHRIHQHRAGGTRAEAVDGIARGVDGRIEAGGQPCGDVATGGEAHHRHAVGIQPAPCGLVAHHAQCALRIGQRRLAVAAGLRQAVAQHEQGVAGTVHPLRHQRAVLLVDHHALVAATGNHQQRAAVAVGRCVHQQVGRIDLVDEAIGMGRIIAALDHARRPRSTGLAGHLSGRPQGYLFTSQLFAQPLARAQRRIDGGRSDGQQQAGQQQQDT
ncbi:hypothetical protein D3C73_682440 [compost metagenome]